MRLLMLVVLLLGSLEAAGAEQRQLEFRVTLDGSPIGYHRYAIEADGARERIVSEASFDVRFLFFTAFRYRHTNREIWDGECLLQLESRTRINGRTLSVSGRQDGDYLVVDDGAEAARLDACGRDVCLLGPAGFAAIPPVGPAVRGLPAGDDRIIATGDNRCAR